MVNNKIRAHTKGGGQFHTPRCTQCFAVKKPYKQNRSARYNYSVWMRYLVLAHQAGLKFPCDVAELGPGDSLGTGLAALLSGAECYYAFDRINYINTEANLKMLDELIDLFQKRTKIPDTQEFPEIGPTKLLLSDETDSTIVDAKQTYAFPAHILPDALLGKTLSDQRIKAIRMAVENLSNPNYSGPITLRYSHGEDGGMFLPNHSFGFVFSQAVLEHVDDPAATYSFLADAMADVGVMAHEIDYKSHGVAKHWNGHWTYPDWVWKLLRGKYPYLINRYSHSEHLKMRDDAGFAVSYIEIKNRDSEIPTSDLALQFRSRPSNDLIISGAYILSRKMEIEKT